MLHFCWHACWLSNTDGEQHLQLGEAKRSARASLVLASKWPTLSATGKPAGSAPTEIARQRRVRSGGRNNQNRCCVVYARSQLRRGARLTTTNTTGTVARAFGRCPPDCNAAVHGANDRSSALGREHTVFLGASLRLTHGLRDCLRAFDAHRRHCARELSIAPCCTPAHSYVRSGAGSRMTSLTHVAHSLEVHLSSPALTRTAAAVSLRTRLILISRGFI